MHNRLAVIYSFITKWGINGFIQLLELLSLCRNWCITTDEYDKLVTRFKSEEQDLQEELTDASRKDETFLNSSLAVLDLAQKAGLLFREDSEPRKQQLLTLVTSNLRLKNGKLVYDLREPFDVLLRFAETKEWLP